MPNVSPFMAHLDKDAPTEANPSHSCGQSQTSSEATKLSDHIAEHKNVAEGDPVSLI